ncbi:MAG TPA: hypothetical protein VKA34_22780 [Balneolales bacterium]|nr:hypothetical protein [Balneolales bacterium]
MQNCSFAQYLHFRDFGILESRKHSGCYGFEVAQTLILNEIPGFTESSNSMISPLVTQEISIVKS